MGAVSRVSTRKAQAHGAFSEATIDSHLTIKICGLNEPVALEAALDAGADMVGFVVFEPSPRHLPLGRGPALVGRVEGRAKKVALTVDASDGTLAAVVKALQPDFLQLHGQETPARVAAVRSRFGLPVIRAISVAEPHDLEAIVAYDAVADMLLFDARAPADADRPGGHGASFDWSLLANIAPTPPWLLAGGLTPENVADALSVSKAPGVDVSSGVESARGKKDSKKIAHFIANARAAGHRLAIQRAE